MPNSDISEKLLRARELRPKAGLMRTQSFLIRVVICFVLSLVPATELENLIYSQRMEFRGFWGKLPEVILIETDQADLSNPSSYGQIQKSLIAAGAAAVYYPNKYNQNDLIIDSDGIVRSAILQPKGARQTVTYAAAHELAVDLSRLLHPKEPHLINYIGPGSAIPHCSWNEVMVVKSPACSELKGKIVLLNDEDDPVYFTPLGEMSRAEVLANEIHTVIFKHAIYRASWLERSAISLGMVLLISFFIMYYPVFWSAVAAISTAILVLGFSFQAVFQFLDIYIPSANIGAAVLITYLLFTGFKLSFQENLHWRSVKQAQYLRDLDKMKTNVLSLLSHDLKTPIAKIQAVAQRLKRELQLAPEDRSDWKELLESIETSNNELKNYITSILNLSMIESQKITLNKKSNDINQIIQWVIKRIHPLTQQKNIKIEENLAPLFAIECDEQLLRQVVSNLVDNAIKYSPAGSTVIIRSTEIEGFIKVEVEDFGPGIAQDQLPMMFRKFARFARPLQDHVKDHVKGTGLGLYLSKYFIELHGGTISVKSVAGKGSLFSFTLPIQSG